MKALLRNIGYGFKGYSKAIHLLFNTRLAWFLLAPFVLYLLTFMINGALGQYFSGSLTDYLIDGMGLRDWAFWGADYLGPALEWIITLSFRIVFFLFTSYISGIFTLILMSPILALLSEKTEQIVSDSPNIPFNLVQTLKDALRGIGIALRNSGIQILYFLLFFVVSFIPLIGVVVSFFGMILISSYFYGFSFMDYTNERRRLSLKASIAMIRKNKSLAILLGGGYWLALTLPFIGSLVGAFVAVFATVAATVAISEMPEYKNTIKSKHSTFEGAAHGKLKGTSNRSLDAQQGSKSDSPTTTSGRK